ncbi:MAG: hypothetical protein CMH53_02980, partial [Myxococcales bacterium]|nr:hypothetical protein [Myxococcales bacterium]
DEELDAVQWVHIAAIHTPEIQMKFVRDIRRRSDARLSAGTYGFMARRSPDKVRALMESVDVFFLNEFEFNMVFEDERPPVRPGQVLIVTRGAQGADVWQGDHCTRVPICPAQPVDLTGAGDSVCGGTLAGLSRGLHPTEAVALGAAVASKTIEDAGMRGLLATQRPDIEARHRATRRDGRVHISERQRDKIGEMIATMADAQPFSFVGPHFPEIGDPAAIDFFFASILHQFGFWSASEGQYVKPTWAQWKGQALKGSDYCFAAFRRLVDRDPASLSPRSQATWRWQDTVELFADDSGEVPMPVLATHHTLSRGYGRDLWELGREPKELVQAAQRAVDPGAYLLTVLDHISGYREDPLRKKSMLLILALGQRPERFIDLRRCKTLTPVVDYHIMRSCLRTGLVEVSDQSLRRRLIDRQLLEPADEEMVRRACYDAMEALMEVSGRDIGTIDYFFFGARKRCPEMTTPDCLSCPVEPICQKDLQMFQPVIRTTFY